MSALMSSFTYGARREKTLGFELFELFETLSKVRGVFEVAS
jgi:hypothetical protein